MAVQWESRLQTQRVTGTQSGGLNARRDESFEEIPGCFVRDSNLDAIFTGVPGSSNPNFDAVKVESLNGKPWNGGESLIDCRNTFACPRPLDCEHTPR